MNYSEVCISEPFAKAVMTPSDVFSWPLTVPGGPQTVINNPVNMSSASQCYHPTMNGNLENFPTTISDKPEELRPQNGIVVYYTGVPVPAFATRFTQPINIEVEKPCSGTDGGNRQGKKERIFPWSNSFSKQCCAAVGNKSVKQLENLLNAYIQHVTPHYNECQKLPNKAFKLMRNINQSMVFLHLLYSDLDEPLENSFYHEKMAEVMAMYIDLEITASRRGKDTVKEVYNRLSSTLYTLLDYSDDHVLDALLKTQLVNKHAKQLCSPFLRKVLTELVVRRPLSALTYVRYVLVFKLWKNVVTEANEKKTINKIALQRLHPPPKFFQDHDIAKPSSEILPKVPKNKKNGTQFYLQSKLNLKDSCRAFFRFCKETNCQEETVYLPCFSEKTEEVESNGCLSLINEILSGMSNDVSDTMPLLGKSEVFSEDMMFCDDTSSLCESEEVFHKRELTESSKKVESPDSGVSLDKEKSKRKKMNDGERDKVPDSTYVMYPDSQDVKSGGDESTDVDGSVTETISETPETSPEPSSTVTVEKDSIQHSCESSDSSFHLHRQGHLPENVREPAPALPQGGGSSNQSPSSTLVSVQGTMVVVKEEPNMTEDDKKMGECGEEFVTELSRNDRLEWPICVPLDEKAALTCQEVMRGGGEWRHYSEKYVGLEEQMLTDDADGTRKHHSSNCHLPLKKRKLAANSNGSPKTDSKHAFPYHAVMFNDADKSNVEELASRDEKREFVETRWCPPEEKCARADVCTSAERRSYGAKSHSESPLETLVVAGKRIDGAGQRQTVSADVPDNLTILAEEAARIWEERAQGTNVSINMSYIPSYAAGKMMSLAEALERQNQKKIEESVIVRNDQYQYYKENARAYTNMTTQYQISEVKSYEDPLVNREDCREQKPIDMSGTRKDSIGLPYSRNVGDKGRRSVPDKSGTCPNCKSSACKGKCNYKVGLSRQVVAPERVNCSNCKSQVCNGKKCKVALWSSVHHVEVSGKVYVPPVNVTNQVSKKYKKCSCKNSGCDGSCKSVSKNQSAFENNGKTTTVNAYRSGHSVCQYCKKSDCDCECVSASPENSKKCGVCKTPSCKGKCKASQNSTNKRTQIQEMHTFPATAKFAKCSYCKSTCFGTCRLAEKKQSLDNARCNLCNMPGCKGKCSTGAVCGHCSLKSCNGACRIHHSVDSILGSSSANSVPVETNRRRTRNSQVQLTKSAPESKRRKKSVSR